MFRIIDVRPIQTPQGYHFAVTLTDGTRPLSVEVNGPELEDYHAFRCAVLTQSGILFRDYNVESGAVNWDDEITGLMRHERVG
jgi:hypothetical protein